MLVHFKGRIRKVGSSLAILIPAAEATRGSLRPGQVVDTTIDPAPEDILGFLKRRGIPYEPFVREPEDRDRGW